MVNQEIDFWTFFQVTVILIGLCQAWIGVFSAVVYAGPTIALKICPMVSALSAFTSGFLVPEPNMPPPFQALFFFNPTFWAIQAIAKLLLKDKLFGCEEYTSKLSCQISSGNFNLASFGFLDGDPVTTGFILLGFIVLTQLFSVWVLLFKHSPDSIHKVFLKWLSNLRCSITLPRFFANGKVADGELVIVRTKDIEPRKEWAKVIGKVIKQQQETFTTEIEAGRIIESSFLEGIGHFLYRRGTNSETILESHNRNYRNQNGVTDEMLERIILILRNGLRPVNESSNRPGEHRSSSVHGGGEKGTYKIKNQAELQVHQMLLANRKRQFQSKFKSAGNNVRNAQRLNSDGIEMSGGLTPTTEYGAPGSTTSLLPTKPPLHVTYSCPTPRRFSTQDPLCTIPGSRESEQDAADMGRRGSAFGNLQSSSREDSDSPEQNEQNDDQFKSFIRTLKPRKERCDQVEDFEEHRLSDLVENSVSVSPVLAASSPTSPTSSDYNNIVTLV
ncbi:uncharacterized protein LOC134816464 [Bolinopsis microptera]|uniref:uncharacterized protein LOC134816464 n=1 Tax=Bolinopsis microptera TaxID=2820187 RepID=UPI00307ABCB0